MMQFRTPPPPQCTAAPAPLEPPRHRRGRSNPGVVFDRERLLKLAWGYDYYGDSRTVDVHVTWLREKLRDSSARIQTVWGVGYKLVEAEPGEAAPARRRRA